MISFLQGTIEEIEDGSAVIGVGGIGFQVQISSETVQRLSSMGRGAEVRIYTFTYLREDMIALFGFLNRDELELFKRLITVSGASSRYGRRSATLARRRRRSSRIGRTQSAPRRTA